MDIFYQIFEKENLIIQKFTGQWDINKYEFYISLSIQTIDYKNIKKVLTDLREVEMKTIFNDIENIKLLRNKLLIKQFLNVHLVTSPIPTAFSALYKEKSNGKKGITIEYCSTIQYAIQLLNIQMSIEEMESKISSLENKV
jgi:hypothetical protein